MQFRVPSTKAATSTPQVAVLIPCHNEEASVAAVVHSFRRVLPSATVYVCDNNSTDCTVEQARAADAVVMRESLLGKGHVLRKMFADIEADVYVLVDGDDTYDAASAVPMVDFLIADGLDMVTGTRTADVRNAYRRGHRFGNLFLTVIVASIFGKRVTDMLSGYRVFSRRFVKSFPALSSGFETETELTIHALELNMPLGEISTPYRNRGENSTSKLRTYRDGVKIFVTILNLIRDQKPLPFFSCLAAATAVIGVVLSIPILEEFHRSHLVPRFPTAFLSMGLVLLSVLLEVCGLILDSVSRGRKELKRMAYLSIPKFRMYDSGLKFGAPH